MSNFVWLSKYFNIFNFLTFVLQFNGGAIPYQTAFEDTGPPSPGHINYLHPHSSSGYESFPSESWPEEINDPTRTENPLGFNMDFNEQSKASPDDAYATIMPDHTYESIPAKKHS